MSTVDALAAVAVAGAASAQVSLYGIVDLGYGNTTEKNAAGTTTDKTSGMQNGYQSGSRWGMKGSEDLGGGLTASFNLESAVGANDGSGNNSFARRSVLELAGGFGKVGMGRDYNPYFGIVGATDVTGVDGAATADLLGGVRTSNMFLYTSPNFSGVTVKLGLSSNSSGTGTSQAKTTSTDISAVYADGPLMVGVAHQTTKVTTAAVAAVEEVRSAVYDINDPTGTTVIGDYISTPAAAAQAQATTKTTNTAIGATYDLGAAKLYFNNLTSKSGSDKSTETNLGVSAPMGAVTLLAGIGRDSDRTATGKASATDFVLGADYSLSKRSNVYARYMKDGASRQADSNAGGKTTGFAVGLRHKF